MTPHYGAALLVVLTTMASVLAAGGCGSADEVAGAGTGGHTATGTGGAGGSGGVNGGGGTLDAGGPDGDAGGSGEICGNGLDDDGDGQPDNGCPCMAGKTQPCFLGKPALAGKGVCV